MWGVRVALSALATAISLPVLAVDKAPAEPERVAIYKESPMSYAGLGLVSANIETDSLKQSPGGIHVRMGGLIDKHWGVEVRAARGFWHERDQLGNQKIQYDIDNLFGAYLTSRWAYNVPLISIPMVDKMFVQANAGAAQVALDTTIQTCTTSCVERTSHNDNASVSWGVGVGLEVRVPQVPNKIGLSLEYMDYGSKYDVDVNTIEAGFQVFF